MREKRKGVNEQTEIMDHNGRKRHRDGVETRAAKERARGTALGMGRREVRKQRGWKGAEAQKSGGWGSRGAPEEVTTFREA